MDMKQILLGLCTGLLLLSCAEKNAVQKNLNWPKGITYEIFVQSFADSDGNGVGDFNGMTSKLPYLETLGVEAIWLMPIMPSPSYHKYDVVDYYDVHPDYGTMEDFKTFVKEAHQRNIRVVIDLVINHSSSKHDWFVEASKGTDNAYREYYVWADKDSIAEEIAKKEISMDSDNITQWHAVNGDTTSEHYYGFFNGGMPDLNFDSPKLRAEVYKIGAFWLQEVGVDGFRLDAAKHIYPDDRAEDNHAFWEEFINEMRQYNPNVYTVGEVWDKSDKVAPYAKGFSALFNFDLAFSILASVQNETSSAVKIEGPTWKPIQNKSFIDGYLENNQLYTSVNKDFFSANFLSNHDQNRVMSVLNGDIQKAKLAASILLTLPGQPYIYYGEEIGMEGKKPDEHIREPMVWSDKDKSNTNWIEATYATADKLKGVEDQLADPSSLLNHYKKMIALRRTHAALSSESIKKIAYEDAGVIAFTRGDGSYLVVHNFTSKDIKLNKKLTSQHPKVVTSMGNNREIIPAFGTLILKK